MIDSTEIKNTIAELEASDTTFAVCEKLANLYTVLDHISYNNVVEKEYSDILPSYRKYCEIKRNYQLGNTSYEFVLSSLNSLLQEITEFMLILYNNTDTKAERDKIYKTTQEYLLRMSD